MKITGVSKVEDAQVWVLFGDTGDGTCACVSREYFKKHDPQIGGYYVRYEDGYESFSPEKVFEEGYSEVPEGPKVRGVI